MKYARRSVDGWDIYEDKKCPACGKSHPIKTNFAYGKNNPDKMRECGYEIITFKELDQLTRKCEPEEEEEDEENED